MKNKIVKIFFKVYVSVLYMDKKILHPDSQKTRHNTLVRNFVKC